MPSPLQQRNTTTTTITAAASSSRASTATESGAGSYYATTTTTATESGSTAGVDCSAYHPQRPAASPSSHLLQRAIQRTEAGLKEIVDQLQQQEAVSSLLLGISSPCALPRRGSSVSVPTFCRDFPGAAATSAAVHAVFSEGAGEASAGATSIEKSDQTASGEDVTAPAATVAAPIDTPTRIYFPLTSQALMPGTLLAGALPPLIHIGNDFFAACKPGELQCSTRQKRDQPSLSSTASQESSRGPAAHISPTAACDSTVDTAAGAGGAADPSVARAPTSVAYCADVGNASAHSIGRSDAVKAASTEETEGCGVLGLLSRRARLLREQLQTLQHQRRQLRQQLALLKHLHGEEADIQQLQQEAAAARAERATEYSEEDGLSNTREGDSRIPAGKARRTADGFVEIVEEYVSDSDEADDDRETKDAETTAFEKQRQQHSQRRDGQQHQQNLLQKQRKQQQEQLRERPPWGPQHMKTEEKQQQQQMPREPTLQKYIRLETQQSEKQQQQEADESFSKINVGSMQNRASQKVLLEKDRILVHEKRTDDNEVISGGSIQVPVALLSRGLVCGEDKTAEHSGMTNSEKGTPPCRIVKDDGEEKQRKEKQKEVGQGPDEIPQTGSTRDSSLQKKDARSSTREAGSGIRETMSSGKDIVSRSNRVTLHSDSFGSTEDRKPVTKEIHVEDTTCLAGQHGTRESGKHSNSSVQKEEDRNPPPVRDRVVERGSVAYPAAAPHTPPSGSGNMQTRQPDTHQKEASFFTQLQKQRCAIDILENRPQRQQQPQLHTPERGLQQQARGQPSSKQQQQQTLHTAGGIKCADSEKLTADAFLASDGTGAAKAKKPSLFRQLRQQQQQQRQQQHQQQQKQ